MHDRYFNGSNFEFGDSDLAWFKLNFLAHSCKFVDSLSLNLNCRMSGRYLHDLSLKMRGCLADFFFRDPFGGFEVTRFALQVVGWRGATEGERSCVFLLTRHVFVDFFCKSSSTYNEQTRCEWIECAGMPHLFYPDRVPDLANGIE